MPIYCAAVRSSSSPRILLVLLLLVAVLEAAAGCGVLSRRSAARQPDLAGLAQALAGASGWLNGGAVAADSLRGRVVVLVIWSDTDPGSLRVLPEAEAWSMAYGRYGVRVLGAHVPQYSFAVDSATTARVLRRVPATFPVALDAESRLRASLGAAELLPRVMVWDAEGRPAGTIEGDDPSAGHAAIRGALRRSRPELGMPPDPPPRAARVTGLRRVACGTTRVTAGPLSGASPGEATTFTAQFRYQEEGLPYTPYVVGRWTPFAEGVTSARGGAADYLAVRSKGGEAWAVLSPPERGSSRVWILAGDDWLTAAECGADVRRDARGASYVDVREPRLYSIARLAQPRTLKLSPDAAGLTVYELDFVVR